VATAPARLDRATLLHGSGARFEVTSTGTYTVGRPDRASGKAPEIDLSTLDTGQTLSRQHAVIAWRDGVFHVKEAKATRNGTFVNGQRVAVGADTPLAPGDRLRFGLVELVFQA
jgi:pSer/pThr/pTyr-binding forkhead associated (FHA) protein